MDPVTFTIGSIFCVSSALSYISGNYKKKVYEKAKNTNNIKDNGLLSSSGYYWTSGLATTSDPLIVADIGYQNPIELLRYNIFEYDVYNISGNKSSVSTKSVSVQPYSYDKQVLRNESYFDCITPIRINNIDIANLSHKFPEYHLGNQQVSAGTYTPGNITSDIDMDIIQNNNNNVVNVRTTNISHKYRTKKYYGLKNNSFLTIIGYYDKGSSSFVSDSNTKVISKPFPDYCKDLKHDYNGAMMIGHILLGIGLGFVGYSFWDK